MGIVQPPPPPPRWPLGTLGGGPPPPPTSDPNFRPHLRPPLPPVLMHPWSPPVQRTRPSAPHGAGPRTQGRGCEAGRAPGTRFGPRGRKTPATAAVAPSLALGTAMALRVDWHLLRADVSCDVYGAPRVSHFLCNSGSGIWCCVGNPPPPPPLVQPRGDRHLAHEQQEIKGLKAPKNKFGYTRILVSVVWCPSPPRGGGGGWGGTVVPRGWDGHGVGGGGVTMEVAATTAQEA